MNYDSESLLTHAPRPPRSKIPLVLGVVVLVCVLGGLFVLLYTKQSAVPEVQEVSSEAVVQAEIDRIVAEANAQPFVFTVVPNALQAITLPPPPESNESDAASYAKLKSADPVPESLVQNDVAYYLPFNGSVYGDYLNTLEDNGEIFQIHDELRQLTLQFDKQYNRPALKDRIAGVVQVAELGHAVYGDTTPSVYPSIRAVDAYATAGIMAILDPDNADGHRENAEALVQRGIAYGLYGQSDADAAKSLVEQYTTLYFEAYPANTTTVTSAEEVVN